MEEVGPNAITCHHAQTVCLPMNCYQSFHCCSLICSQSVFLLFCFFLSFSLYRFLVFSFHLQPSVGAFWRGMHSSDGDITHYWSFQFGRCRNWHRAHHHVHTYVQDTCLHACSSSQRNRELPSISSAIRFPATTYKMQYLILICYYNLLLSVAVNISMDATIWWCKDCCR